MKKVVGIVPSAALFETNDLYQDRYAFVNHYCLRTAQHGGVPMGLLSVDGMLVTEALDRVDSLLICGGSRIHPYHFQAVQHAVETGKPLLGICLGMQAIHSYFIVADEAKRRNFHGSLLELYGIMKKEKYMFLLPVEHHWDVHCTRDNVQDVKHPVALQRGTLIHRLLGQDQVMGASMHRYRIDNPSPRLTVSGRAQDGTIEAVEYKNHIVGVQFHPEVDGELGALFRFLSGKPTASL